MSAGCGARRLGVLRSIFATGEVVELELPSSALSADVEPLNVQHLRPLRLARDLLMARPALLSSIGPEADTGIHPRLQRPAGQAPDRSAGATLNRTTTITYQRVTQESIHGT